ncbi:MAG: carboxypeptidase regulatory-like domain-containing protein [Terriglobales bacterium]
MPAAPASARTDKRRSLSRALRPIVVWFLGSALFLAWGWYQRRAEETILTFTVLLEGHQAGVSLSVKLDGQEFQPGARVAVGRRTLLIEGPGLDPVTNKVFVWLGTNNLGEIKLVRSKGRLEVNSEPPPRMIEVAGALFKNSSANAHAVFDRIPVGDYAVTATFEHFWERREVQVRRNETTRVDFRPAFGALDLTSDPTGVPFTLTAVDVNGLSIQGTTPGRISQLPAGPYRVVFQQLDGSVTEATLKIRDAKTNSSHTVFPYGTLQLTTIPPGAAIYSGPSTLGKTPQTLQLKPGEYQFRLALDGYQPRDLTVTIGDKKTISITTNLVNARVAEALDAARAELNSASGDYDRALRQVADALRIEPSNAEATALTAALTAAAKDREANAEKARHTAYAQAAEQARKAQETAKKAEEQARRRDADQKFAEATREEKDADLFPTRIWAVTNQVDTLSDAVLRMLQRKDSPWKLLREERLYDQTRVLRCEGKGLFKSQEKRCVVMIREMSPGQVFVYAKFWEYVGGARIPFLSPASDGYVPVAPGRYKPEQPGAAEAYLKAVEADFLKRLSKELE